MERDFKIWERNNSSVRLLLFMNKSCVMWVSSSCRFKKQLVLSFLEKRRTHFSLLIMIAVITFNNSLVHLIEGVCSSNPYGFEFSGWVIRLHLLLFSCGRKNMSKEQSNQYKISFQSLFLLKNRQCLCLGAWCCQLTDSCGFIRTRTAILHSCRQLVSNWRALCAHFWSSAPRRSSLIRYQRILKNATSQRQRDIISSCRIMCVWVYNTI